MKKFLLSTIIAFSFYSTQTLEAQTYCTPTFNPAGCWTGADINSVTFGTFSDLNTGCTGAGYADKTSLTGLSLTVGASQSFTLTSTSGGLGMYFAIWIDLNNDGDFADANEFVWNGLSSGVSAGSFTVPSGSGTRRLRILGKQSTSPLTQSESCQGAFWGEIQDYNCVLGTAGCAIPTGLFVHSLVDTSATLAWLGSGTKYIVEYGATGFTQGAGTLDSTITNEKSINGLSATTQYDFYVKNVCSPTNQSGWNGPFTFRTRCTPVNTYPFNENFDAQPWIPNYTPFSFNSDSISICWSRYPLFNFSYAWVVRNGSTISLSSGPNVDASSTGLGNYIHTSSSGSNPTSPQTAIIELPVFDLSGLTSPTLSYKYHMAGAGIGKLYVEASVDGAQTWTTIDSLKGTQQSTNTSSWLNRTVSVTSVKSSLTYFRLRAVSYDNNGDIAVDDILLDEAPACPAPNSPVFTTILGDGATISWSSAETNFQIEYGPTGFVQGTGTIDTVTNATSFSISGLMGETYYDVYLRSDCSAMSNGNSAWLGPVTFRTYTLPPFIETFNTGFLPDSRWLETEALIGTPTSFGPNYFSAWLEGGFLNNGSTGSAKVSCFSTSTRNEWFFTKSIDLGTNNIWELYFDVGLTANGTSGPSTLGADDKLLVIVSTDNGVTWSSVNTLLTLDQNSSLSNASSTITQPLTGYSGVVKFGFYLESTVTSPNGFDLFIDNIGVRNPGSCPQASAIFASNVGTNSLWLNWTSSGTVNNYTVEYGPQGFVQGTGTVIGSISADSVLISGLSPVTSYDFYIQSNCDTGNTSNWVGPMNVLSGCPSIFSTPYTTNFDVNDAGSAVFGGKMSNCWVANPMSSGFHWRTGTSGQSHSGGQTGPSVDHTNQNPGVGKYVYADATLGPDAFLTAGPFDLSTLNEPVLKFYYHMFGAGMGTLHVDVSTDENNWTTDLITIKGQKQNASTDLWKYISSPLASFLNDTIYVRFRAEYGSSFIGDMAVDDFSIEEAKTCEPPNGLTTVATTGTTATLSWQTFEASTSIEYGAEGFVQGTGVGTIVNSANPNMTLSGLTPNTFYDYYVKDTCNPTKWVGPHTFKTECIGALSGTYTIGGATGPTNFTTVDSALARLNQCGISGPVIFNLNNINEYGFYHLNEITGSSATNTITFNSTSGTDTLHAPTIDYLFKISGTAHVYFEGITFENKNGNSVVWLADQAHHIYFNQCSFVGINQNSNSTSTLVSGSFAVGSPNSYGKNAHHITITNSAFFGNYYGININGIGSQLGQSISIKNNSFNESSIAIKLAFIDSATVENNTVLSSGSAGTGVSIFSTGNVTINKNKIRTIGNGIYVGSPFSTVNVINNQLIAGNSGIELNNVAGINIFHNSISATNYGVLSNSMLSALDLRNNIIVSVNNHAFHAANSPTNTVIDYNVYNTKGGILAHVGGINYATLTNWQTGIPSYNTNALQGDPLFLSPSDLTTLGTLANDVGDNTVGILEDIQGNTRPKSPSTTVDIGAYEYTPKMFDASIERIYEPIIGCGDSNTTVSVIVKNWGLNTITTMPINVEATGSINATINYTYNGNLLSLETDTVVVGTINTFAGGAGVHISAFTSLANDEDFSNDTIQSTLEFIPGKPQYLPLDSICKNATSASINAQPLGSVTYSWYTSATATTATDTGQTFTFNPTVQKTWFLGYGYADADTLTSLLTTNTGGNGGIMFTLKAKRNINIDSLFINSTYNVGTPTPVRIYYNTTGAIIGAETDSTSWIFHESMVVSSAGALGSTPVILSNPIVIPAGATYSIYVYAPVAWLNVTSVANQIYNSAFMQIEPGVGLLGKFTFPVFNKQFSGSIFASEYVCSTQRVQIDLPLADSAMASFTTVISQPDKVDVDASASNGQNVQWNFGDGTSGAGFTATHTYVNGGNYTITCIVEDTVCNTFDTATFSVNMTIGINENPLANSLKIYPNPSEGIFQISFDLATKSDVKISVVDATGRVLQQDELSNISQLDQFILDLNSQPSGLYFVHISTNQNTAVTKITKQ